MTVDIEAEPAAHTGDPGLVFSYAAPDPIEAVVTGCEPPRVTRRYEVKGQTGRGLVLDAYHRLIGLIREYGQEVTGEG
jgi:hypothetical protein